MNRVAWLYRMLTQVGLETERYFCLLGRHRN
jgi:hypothetical protein